MALTIRNARLAQADATDGTVDIVVTDGVITAVSSQDEREEPAVAGAADQVVEVAGGQHVARDHDPRPGQLSPGLALSHLCDRVRHGGGRRIGESGRDLAADPLGQEARHLLDGLVVARVRAYSGVNARPNVTYSSATHCPG